MLERRNWRFRKWLGSHGYTPVYCAFNIPEVQELGVSDFQAPHTRITTRLKDRVAKEFIGQT